MSIHFVFHRQVANGLRYPLVGGTRQRYFAGTNSKPRKLLENAQTPTSRVHAVLGGFHERKTPSLKQDTTTELPKLLHEPMTLTTDKNHDLPKRG
jgi:hypothetical protein